MPLPFANSVAARHPFTTTVSVMEYDGAGNVRHLAWKEEGGWQNASPKWQKAEIVAFGKDNTYPDWVLFNYINCGTLRIVADKLAQMIAGSGFVVVTNLDANAEERVKLASDYLALIGVNQQLIELLAQDAALMNAIAAQVVKQANGNKPAAVKHTPLHTVRAARPDVKDPNQAVANFWISFDWTKVDPKLKPRRKEDESAKPESIAAYPARQPGEETILPKRSLYYARRPNPASDFYALPDCESGKNEMRVEISTGEYLANYVDNGMSSSAIMKVPFEPYDPAKEDGSLSDADAARKESIRKEIATQLSGKKRAGQITVVFWNPAKVDDQGRPTGIPTFEKPIEEGNDRKYLEGAKDSRERLRSVLGVVDPQLFGFTSPSGFSNDAQRLRLAQGLLDTLTVAPKRNLIVGFINEMLIQGGFPDCTVQIENTVLVENEVSIDAVREGIVTKNEARENMGYAPLEEEQESGNPAQEANRYTVGVTNAIIALLKDVKAGLIDPLIARNILIDQMGLSPEQAEKLTPDTIVIVPPKPTVQ